jgi:hypothetical protein
MAFPSHGLPNLRAGAIERTPAASSVDPRLTLAELWTEFIDASASIIIGVTAGVYAYDWGRFRAWLTEREVEPVLAAITNQVLVDYIAGSTPAPRRRGAVRSRATPSSTPSGRSGRSFAGASALERVGIVERLRDRSRSFRLTKEARDQMGSRVRYRRSSCDDQWEMVRAHLDAYPDISRDEVATLLSIALLRATKILSKLVRLGRVVHVGPSRGRSVRYRLP